MTDMITNHDSGQEKNVNNGSLSLNFDVRSLVQGIRVKPAEFARMCGCSRQTVSRWVADGLVSLFPDGTLDPASAAKSVLGKKNPGRIKAAVFRDLAQTTDDLRRQLKEATAELDKTRTDLASCRETLEFSEGAFEELFAVLRRLPEAVAAEWSFISSLDPSAAETALKQWLDYVNQFGLEIVPSFESLMIEQDSQP